MSTNICLRALSKVRCYFLRLKDEVRCKKERWQRKWRGRGGGCKGQRKEGVRGSERGTDSVPTLLITVSLETERGLPLALGNSLGPVAEREQRGRDGGKGAEESRGGEGREGRVEFKRV